MDRVEAWRIVLVLLCAAAGGLTTGHWLASLSVALAAYSAWMLFKQHQLLRWLENGASAARFPDSSGLWERIAWQIQAMRRKSSKRKKARSQLLKRSQSIISALPYAVVLLSKSNEVEWANKTAQLWLNISNKRDRGQRLENLLRLPRLYDLLDQEKREEIEIVYPPGSNRHLAIQVLSIKKGPKLLIARDISERVNLQRMRRSFIANASHELRTPLTVVCGYLEMIQEDATLPDHLRQAVEAAGQQARQMQHIIEDLLTLSRLESSSIDPSDLEIIDMAKLIQQHCLDTAKRLGDTTHRIESDIDDSLTIRGIPAELISVCTNLVSNAIRHTPAGTTVRIEWKKTADERACLSISDNGPGIPAEHIPHLTERFYRVDKGRSRETGGTGLGLAIVQHIVERHNGKLTITSEPGQGATFRACFPSN